MDALVTMPSFTSDLTEPSQGEQSGGNDIGCGLINIARNSEASANLEEICIDEEDDNNNESDEEVYSFSRTAAASLNTNNENRSKRLRRMESSAKPEVGNNVTRIAKSSLLSGMLNSRTSFNFASNENKPSERNNSICVAALSQASSLATLSSSSPNTTSVRARPSLQAKACKNAISDEVGEASGTVKATNNGSDTKGIFFKYNFDPCDFYRFGYAKFISGKWQVVTIERVVVAPEFVADVLYIRKLPKGLIVCLPIPDGSGDMYAAILKQSVYSFRQETSLVLEDMSSRAKRTVPLSIIRLKESYIESSAVSSPGWFTRNPCKSTRVATAITNGHNRVISEANCPAQLQ